MLNFTVSAMLLVAALSAFADRNVPEYRYGVVDYNVVNYVDYDGSYKE